MKAGCLSCRTILVATVILFAGCGRRDAPRGSFAVTDSASVTIIESVQPVWGSGEGWALSSEPDVVIGGVEGDDKYVLGRVAGLRRLTDGRIAVLDGGSQRVRLYDGTGRHLRDLGGPGDGPGEFSVPQFLGLIADTLLVYDAAHDNLTWFSPAGDFLRTSPGVRLPGQKAAVATSVFGFLAGHFLVGGRTNVFNLSFVDGLNRTPWSVWRFNADSAVVDSLFAVPGAEQIVSHAGRGIMYRPHVFGKWTQLAASTSRLYVAPNDAFAVQVFDEFGTLRRIIRRPWAPRSVSPSDLSQWVEQTIERRARSPEEKADMKRNAGDLSVAETLPAFRSMAVDTQDHLWVEQWEGAGFAQGLFAVFRDDGAWLGEVEVPNGLSQERGYWGGFGGRQLVEIGPDYFMGVWTDDLDVEQVRLYRIQKR
jgi:hypothetical protein